MIQLRVAHNQYRVADLAYFTAGPTVEIPVDPPFAVIEIVSPDDRHDEIAAKLDDYERAGVAYIFLADPSWRKLSLYRGGSLLSVNALEMPELDVKTSLDVISMARIDGPLARDPAPHWRKSKSSSPLR